MCDPDTHLYYFWYCFRSSSSQYLPKAVLCVLCCLALCWLASGSLLCNYSPLLDKLMPSMNSTTQCLSHQRCFSAKGYFGKLHAFSSQGCVAADLCGSFKMVQYKQIHLKLTFTCCCRDRCNQPPLPESVLEKVLGVTLSPVNDATTPDPLDLCDENSTAPTTASV